MFVIFDGGVAEGRARADDGLRGYLGPINCSTDKFGRRRGPAALVFVYPSVYLFLSANIATCIA
eukprot:gene33098-20122_t